MAFPTIQYDATNGSDTAPNGDSGNGIDGDISGTTLTLNTTVDFTSGNPVADDGSDYLWIDTPSGDRHLYQITAFNPNTTACTSLTLGQSAPTARVNDIWYVNGERKTFNWDATQRDWEDWEPGWTIELQNGTYDTPVTISMQGGDVTDGRITIKNKTGESPVIRTTADLAHFTTTASMTTLEGIKFTTSASPTKTSTELFYRQMAGHNNIEVINCEVEALQYVIRGWNEMSLTFVGCLFKDIVNSAFLQTGSADWHQNTLVKCCEFIGCGDHAIDFFGGAKPQTLVCINCIFHGTSGNGINLTATTTNPLSILIDSCTFDGNTDGIEVVSGVTDELHVVVRNSLFSNNTNGIISAAPGLVTIDYNAFYNNTNHVGSNDNVVRGPNTVTCNSDPYTNRAGDDFSLNTTSDGGALCRGTGLPGAFKSGNVTGYEDIGAVQHQDAGGVAIPNTRRNTMIGR